MLLNVCYTLIKLYGINKKGTLGTIFFFFFLDGSMLQIFITDITSCFAFSFAFLKETA